MDTDVASYIMRRRPIEYYDFFVENLECGMYISTATYAELVHGALWRRSQRIDGFFAWFLPLVRVVPWTIEAGQIFAEIKTDLKIAGTPLDAMDLIIASTALSRDMELVTNNLRHFGRIKGLKIIQVA